MSFLFLAAATMLAQPASSHPATHTTHAPAATPASATAQRLSINTTRIADLMANDAAKAVIERHLPGFSNHPQLGAAAGMTLKAVQPFAQGMITDAHLQAIERDLAALPAR